RDPDLAVGFETPNARAMPCTRINYDEWAPLPIDLDAGGRNDPHERVVHRPREGAAVDDEVHLVVEDMRSGLGLMGPVLVPALAQRIPEQHAPLRRVDHVLHGRSEHTKR